MTWESHTVLQAALLPSQRAIEVVGIGEKCAEPESAFPEHSKRIGQQLGRTSASPMRLQRPDVGDSCHGNPCLADPHRSRNDRETGGDYTILHKHTLVLDVKVGIAVERTPRGCER